MTKYVAGTTKKILAAGGLALGVGCVGLLASTGIAAAHPNCAPEAACTSSLPADPSYPAGSSGYGTRDTASNPGVASIEGHSR
ncbi:MAG: hypothetical protein JWQ86_1400 [Mycobacterium sp.]|jgi:hypothetical protein|nr:hypothetical protein [Mycobacterium sp.]